MRWVEDETYTRADGKPMKRQVTTVKLCDCYYERQFKNYNPTDGLKEEELSFTFKTAVIDDYNKAQYLIATEFVRNIKENMKDGVWLYIFGDENRVTNDELSAYGSGKTYLMICIANALAHRRIPGIYVTEEDLFKDIKSTYEKNSEETEATVLERYYQVPILMIDDIFSAQYTEWSQGKLFSILNERDRMGKVTIMTSNFANNRIRERLQHNGGKLASRIKGRAIEIEMIGPDRRPGRQHNKSA